VDKTCTINSNGINVTVKMQLERIVDPLTLTHFIYRISLRIENSSPRAITLTQRILSVKQYPRLSKIYISNGFNGQFPKINPNRFLTIQIPFASQATPVFLQHIFHFQTQDGQALLLKTPEQTLAPYVFN
jgi:hypothetical protein